MTQSTRGWRALFRTLCLLFPVAASGVYPIATGDDGTRGARYLALHAGLTLLMLGAWASGQRVARREQQWALLAGIMALLVLVPAPVFTTHDVIRYLWDGRVALAGLDPYVVTPETAPVGFDPAWPRPPDNTNYQTIYPPVAISLFTLCAGAGAEAAPWLWKAMVVLAAVLLLLAGERLLRRRRASHHLPLLALSPLLLLEAGVGAHLDVLAALAVVVTLLAFAHQRLWLAGVAAGMGVMFKFVPGLVLLPLLLVLPWRRALRMGLAAAAVVVAGYGAALLLGMRPLGSLAAFFVKWRFGSPLYTALDSVVDNEQLGYLFAPLAAVAAVAVVVVTRRSGDWAAGARRMVVAPFVLSPVVFPWYLVPLVPLAALRPSAFTLLWVSVLPLTYEVLDAFDANGVWNPAVWPLWLIGIGWIAGLVTDAVVARLRSR